MNRDKQQYDAYTYHQEMPMKWFKFIIYFQLFASALINLGTGWLYLTGSIYSNQSEYVTANTIYSFYPKLLVVDKFYGVCLIGLAIAAIFVRMKLAKFHKGAPQFYYVFLGCSAILLAIYTIASSAILGGGEFSSVVGNIVGMVVLLLANMSYFQKRAHLFIY